MAALRIVHLDASRNWRGGQQQLLLLARALARLGADQAMVTRPGETSERLRAAGFEVLAPGWGAVRRLRVADIAHSHDGLAHSWMLAATAGRRAHRPVRALSRRVAYPIRSPASAWKYRRLDLIFAVSEAVRREVLETGVAERTIELLPDGVDLDGLPAPEPTRAAVRSRLGWPETTPVMVCLGAFSPEKGVGDAIAALARLDEDWRLALPGQGEQEEVLKKQARELRVNQRVRFAAGDAIPTAAWVAAADVFVMPSRQEGLGSAALLAMALARPVAATTAGGIPELIEHERTGLLSDPTDAAALAANCRRLREDPELAQRLSAAARVQVRERHDIRLLAAATWRAYERVREGR